MGVPFADECRTQSTRGNTADREIKYHAVLGFAGPAERGHVQIRQSCEQTRQQAHQPAPQLIAFHGWLENANYPSEADEHDTYQAGIHSFRITRITECRGSNEEYSHPDGRHV